jgi:hypothetical protein
LASQQRSISLRADPWIRGPHLLETGDGYVYCIGLFWYRIKLSTMTAERLTSTPMPSHYRGCGSFAVSRHYGLVVWNEGKLFRITVDETSVPRSGGPMVK